MILKRVIKYTLGLPILLLMTVFIPSSLLLSYIFDEDGDCLSFKECLSIWWE
jgi:hypothetical protein